MVASTVYGLGLRFFGKISKFRMHVSKIWGLGFTLRFWGLGLTVPRQPRPLSVVSSATCNRCHRCRHGILNLRCA